MTGREKVLATVLLVLFFGVGLATLYEGVLIINDYTVKNHGNDRQSPQPAISAASQSSGSLEFSGEPTRTPMMPVLPTPVSATQTEVITMTPNPIVYAEDLSLAQALQMGWTTVTVFTPWGDPMVFSFQPVTVNFREPNFDWVCPYYQQNACLAIKDEGVYALMHSEYPGAVAEQARLVVEGSLFPLETIQRNVAMLTGSEAEISLQDGRVLRTTVTNFTRTTGSWNMYNLANNREVLPNTLTIEFCGLPHLGDQTDSAGATGSVYVLSLSKGD
jgi:hypothetical protein